jgi:hypothetical protein
MLKENDRKEIGIVGKSMRTIALLLWGVLPMEVLGWLVSAINRHTDADNALRDEPVYWFLAHWHGGSNAMAALLPLAIIFLIIFCIRYALQKTGHSEPGDGMQLGRTFLRKVIIPSMLSSSAYASGMLSQGTVKTLIGSIFLLIACGMLVAVIQYITDTTEVD